MAHAYRLLLEQAPSPESLVRKALAQLEADFRELSLVVLAEWEQLGIAAPEMFSAIASLQRPSWGSWNGMLSALQRARKAILRKAEPELRQKIESAQRLNQVVALLSEKASKELKASLKPLAEMTRSKLGKKAKLNRILALPIGLRNRVAHDAPTDPLWWQAAADAIRPLVAWHAKRQPCTLVEDPSTLPSPWFELRDGEVWAFNGLNRDFSVHYISSAGAPRHSDDGAQAMLLAFQRLLGKADSQQKDFKRLLSKHAPEELKGVMMGDFLVGPPVGKGGFATVHRGRQLSTGRRVAVKILHDGMPEDAKLRFNQEAAYLSRFDQHVHIVDVIGYGEETWSAPRMFSLSEEEWFQKFSKTAPVKTYIALEWVEGRSLEEVYQELKSGTLEAPPEKRLAEWFAAAANALDVVHSNGLIHRDIKPGNLMVDGDGHLYLMDFGIARTHDENRTLVTEVGSVPGTSAYMSPEQLRAADADAEVGTSTDIYGLCATFYELFTQTRLFDHDRETAHTVRTKKIDGVRVEKPHFKGDKLSWELETILLGGLEPEVSDRYASMEDLERDLRHYLADEPIGYKRPGPLRRLLLRYRRHRGTAHMLAAFALLFACFLLWLYRLPVDFSVETLPTGARVTLDGELLEQRTPLVVPLAFGKHRLQVAHDDYHSAVRELTVSWGRAHGDATEELILVPAFEVHRFESIPAEARVRVLDAASGEVFEAADAPATLVLPVGSYDVFFDLPGHVDPEGSHRLEVVGGSGIQPISARLSSNLATLHFAGEVDWTVVEAFPGPYCGGGEAWLSTNCGQPLQLPPGDWSLRFSRRGDLPRWQHLRLAPHDSQDVYVQLDNPLRWTVETQDWVYSTPVCGDLNGDGRSEVVFGSHDGKLRCVSAAGQPLWDHATEPLQPFASSPQLADLNGDGRPEVLVGNHNGQVLCYDATGKELWQFRTGAKVRSSPAVGDLDGDGIVEIVIGSMDGELYCLRPDGSRLASFELAAGTECSPALADLDGDGRLEVVIGAAGTIYALTLEAGQLIERWSFDTGQQGVYATPAIGDLDGDGTPEVVVGSYLDARLQCLDANGRPRWLADLDPEAHVYASAALADLDEDGRLEVLVGAYDGHFRCFASDGRERWSYNLGARIHSSPLVVDSDGDGRLEILVGCTDGTLYAFDTRGLLLWSYATSDRLQSSPMAADLDGDGRLEILIGSYDGFLCCLYMRPQLRWSYDTDDLGQPDSKRLYSSPVSADLDGDGQREVVVGSGANAIHCVGSDGLRRWKYRVYAPVHSSPAIGDLRYDQGLEVVVGSMDGHVFEISTIGSGRWIKRFGPRVRSSPAIFSQAGSDTLAVFGSKDGRVYAAGSADGEVVWSHATGGEVWASPTLADVDGDGRIEALIGSYDGLLYCFDALDGTLRWTYATASEAPEKIYAAATVVDLGGDGLRQVYFGSLAGVFHAVDAEGVRLWSFEIPENAEELSRGIMSQAAVLQADGRELLVFGCNDHKVYAVDARSGEQVWDFATDAANHGAITVADLDGDGPSEVLVPSRDHHLYCLNEHGQPLWQFETRGEIYARPLASDLDGDGSPEVVIGSYDGFIYCLEHMREEGRVVWAFPGRKAAPE